MKKPIIVGKNKGKEKRIRNGRENEGQEKVSEGKLGI